jgi:hypothetical protein
MIQMNWMASYSTKLLASSRPVGFGTLDVGWMEHFPVNLFSQRQLLVDVSYLFISFQKKHEKYSNIFSSLRRD